MAAPAWSDVVQSGVGSLGTPLVVTMPANLATGDRVVIFVTMGRNRTQGLTWPSGFQSALGGTTFNTAGNDHEHDFGYGDISGSPPATITLTPNVTKAFLAWAGRIPAGTFDPSTAPEFTTTANSADPASLDPSWSEDTLFIAGISADELTFVSFPLADDQHSAEISLVSGAVCSIGQTGGAARNVAAWATTEANLKGVAVVCIRASAAGTPATATPAVIAATSSLPAAGLNVAAGPAAAAAAASLPQASAGSSTSVTPAAITAVVSLPVATPSAGVTLAPAAIAASTALPQAALAVSSTVAPSAVAAVVSVPQSGVSVAAGPSAIAATVSMPQVSAGSATVVQPAAVSAVASLPAAGVSAGSIVAPAAVSAVVSLPPASPVTEGGAVATPSAVAVTVTLPQASAQAQTVVSPGAIPSVVSLPAPSVSAGVVVSPAALAVVVSFPQATATGGGQSSDPVAATFTENVGATYQEPHRRVFREAS